MQVTRKFETNRDAVNIHICYAKIMPCPSPATVKYQSVRKTV